MYGIDDSVSTVTRAAMALAGLCLLAQPACAPQPRPAVRPAVVRLAGAKDTVNLVLAAVRADTMFDTLPGVGDDQRLMLGTTCPGDCRYGPRVKIQPHRAASYLTETDREAGVVIARIINLDTLPYPKFNLSARDTVYWWVSMRQGKGVSIFVSSVRGVRPRVGNLEIEYHADLPYRQSLARWIWSDHDELAWGTCDGGSCCKSSGVAAEK
jgi:hypothetical protein